MNDIKFGKSKSQPIKAVRQVIELSDQEYEDVKSGKKTIGHNHHGLFVPIKR